MVYLSRWLQSRHNSLQCQGKYAQFSLSDVNLKIRCWSGSVTLVSSLVSNQSIQYFLHLSLQRVNNIQKKLPLFQ